jgi:hypothetical protein
MAFLALNGQDIGATPILTKRNELLSTRLSRDESIGSTS